MANPPKVPTQEQIDALVEALEDPYITLREACMSVGIPVRRFYRMLGYAEQGNEDFYPFAAAMYKARGEQIRHYEAEGRFAASNGNASGVAWNKWMLEVRHRKTHGREVQKIEHSGPDGAPIQTDNRNENRVAMTEETAEALRKHVLGIGSEDADS